MHTVNLKYFIKLSALIVYYQMLVFYFVNYTTYIVVLADLVTL